jgi:CRISPR/Cas system CSM-associated protein Csm3 (group 7 of RAMP superfamily)
MIRHPYQFIRFARNAPAIRNLTPAAMTGHERVDPELYSGTFHCELEAVTPLSIKQHFADLRRIRSRVWLPGSSIKGMIRNLAEMLGAGCTLYFGYKTQRRSPVDPHTPIQPCGPNAACPVCRIFGYAPPRKEGGWQGKARFHDSASLPRVQWMESPSGGNARLQFQDARHTAFYGTTQNPAGWKIYRHAKKATAAHPDFIAPCVPSGTVFSFNVDFENLCAEEFAILQFCLSLDHQCPEHSADHAIRLCHKLGYGKGLGLGSCRIRVKTQLEDPRRYFGKSKIAEPAQPRDCLLRAYLQQPGFEMVKSCLSWEGAADRLEFPDQKWFLGHSRDSIAQFEEEKNRGTQPVESGRVPIADLTTTRPAPTGLPLNKRVKVKLTLIKGAQAAGVTLEEFGGIRYTARFEKPFNAQEGEIVSVIVESVDQRNRTFKGRQARRL